MGIVVVATASIKPMGSHAVLLCNLFILTHCIAKTFLPVKVIQHRFWMQCMQQQRSFEYLDVDALNDLVLTHFFALGFLLDIVEERA